jgi:hypothetical protein
MPKNDLKCCHFGKCPKCLQTTQKIAIAAVSVKKITCNTSFNPKNKQKPREAKLNNLPDSIWPIFGQKI